jgi:hypothetical protein
VRAVAALILGVAVGLAVGWLLFGERGSPGRHDVEQAVLASGFGTPTSARCSRLAGADHIWNCTAQFPDGKPYD